LFSKPKEGVKIVNAEQLDQLKAMEDKSQLDEDTGIDIINKNNLLNQKNLEQAVRAGYLRTDEEFLKQGFPAVLPV
jgi:hypothetical protein